MSAPHAIVELVERFDRYREVYRSHRYNETQVRREFIDPFFEGLGWDIANRQGSAEPYKDVIHEDAIKVGGATKAPDYCFRIGGIRKFFLEAKRPAINLREDASPAFQLRRYAWSAKLPLSILTDFEELSVYDCRVQPMKTDHAVTARLLYITYPDYAQRWDDIANIFSRQAVLTGAFDAYAVSTRSRRGTLEVDTAFLKEIESWRALLARHLALRNPDLSQRQLNYAVQTTIDRIIFLRICEDRGIEEYGQLMALLPGSEVYSRLGDLFRRADERYNSGLFHFQQEKGRAEWPDELTLRLIIDDEPLKEILQSIYYPDSPYEFSVLPANILGQVYEQFLGKVIRLTANRRAVVEEKPEVRKAGGVYYTPSDVVDFIVKETVGTLFDGKTLRQAARLKILDPACGSGSFLINVYQHLLDWYRDQYVTDGPAKHVKVLFQGPGGDWRLTTAERKRILLSHIYGVDIDPQAVEVTKLSLLLKVLEGENQQTLLAQLRLFQERALPDLGRNIKCGNSLIHPNFYDSRQTELLSEEERSLVNAFDWKVEFPQVLQAKNGGFDAIIGNPPYGASLSREETAYLLVNFKLQDYQLDTYVLFIEQALILLRQSGLLGMIIPNTWLLNLQSRRIREYIFNRTQMKYIVHYRRPVFTQATVDTEIIIITNQKPSETHQIAITVIEKDGRTSSYTVSQARWQAGQGRPVNIFERAEFTVLADKLQGLHVLDSVCLITQGAKPFQVGKGKPPQTRKIVEEKPFVSETKQHASFRPLLRGSLIQRYQMFWNNNYWISFGDWLAEPRYSAWYDAPAKIVIRQTGDSLIATLDRHQFIIRDNLYMLVPREKGVDLRYILGLLNSRLLNWYYQIILNPEKGEALAQVKRGHLARLPIVLPNLSVSTDKDLHDRMVELVEQMLSRHQQVILAQTAHEKTLLQRQIEATDRRIDRLVYQLYGLTAEEITIVEQATR